MKFAVLGVLLLNFHAADCMGDDAQDCYGKGTYESDFFGGGRCHYDQRPNCTSCGPASSSSTPVPKRSGEPASIWGTPNDAGVEDATSKDGAVLDAGPGDAASDALDDRDAR